MISMARKFIVFLTMRKTGMSQMVDLGNHGLHLVGKGFMGRETYNRVGDPLFVKETPVRTRKNSGRQIAFSSCL